MRAFSTTFLISLVASASATSTPKLVGDASFESTGDLVTYTLGGVYNTSRFYSTDTMRVSFVGIWKPFTGITINGDHLYSFELESLGGWRHTEVLTDTVAFARSPTDYTYILVTLSRWDRYRFVQTDYQNVEVAQYFPSSFLPPSITTQPQGRAADAGNEVTFSVTADGSGTLSYQWYLDGVYIPGATSPSYTIASVNSSDAGSYSVTVSNKAGNIPSASATLTVKPRFELWREAHFTAEELLIDSISGPDADPDLDRHSNLMEYALALNPLQPSFGIPLQFTLSGDFCVLTYTRPADRDDLTYVVEARDHLLYYGWSYLWVTHERIAPGDPEIWQGRYYSGRRAGFMRLRVYLNTS